MRLRRIKLMNFRSYTTEKEICIDDLTVFIGKNDSGKSSIFDALEIFFNERENCTAWITSKKELENYVHRDLVSASYPGYAGQGTDFEDVPSLFAQAVHEASDSEINWSALDEIKRDKKISRGKNGSTQNSL